MTDSGAAPRDEAGRSAVAGMSWRDVVFESFAGMFARPGRMLLFLMLGGVSLPVGAIGIANVTLVSVMERTGEIGLRRAMGATRRHIATQFLLESATMGAVGGVLGASAGMLVVVGVAFYQTWTPVIGPWIPLLAPVVGGATGLMAGLYPALRAAGLEPVEALRAGT